jgi:hypothetical protein
MSLIWHSDSVIRPKIDGGDLEELRGADELALDGVLGKEGPEQAEPRNSTAETRCRACKHAAWRWSRAARSSSGGRARQASEHVGDDAHAEKEQGKAEHVLLMRVLGRATRQQEASIGVACRREWRRGWDSRSRWDRVCRLGSHREFYRKRRAVRSRPIGGYGDVEAPMRCRTRKTATGGRLG